eukprot:TRINITY_DN11542_c0_g1_i1.p1 TRINITY_DN11542_c0_g1~~TRINITY_DN11542_c0_g1_i1.p1  ORF type:complete len:458 (+),score=67.73 TRINITY_DN11542_c0_g1_i1:93-1466(+)
MQRLQSISKKFSTAVSLWIILAETAIVLDDQDLTLERHTVNAHEGSFQPCMEDAYGGNFHHDWAGKKGEALFSMSFDPAESGCYALEERHPGRNPSCAKYLPRNAQLVVDYCRGLSANLSVDQSTRGGQWNHVANFMFYKGSRGKITMRNSPDEDCNSQNCFWIVDAFRLTRLGASCANAASLEQIQAEAVMKTTPEMDAEPSNGDHLDEVISRKPDKMAASAARMDDKRDSMQAAREGVITLRLQTSVDADSGDYMIALNANIAGVEAVLATHFGHDEAEVRDVFSRRLVADAPTYRVHFSLYGVAKTARTSDENLAQKLSVVLAPAGIQVVSAEEQWLNEFRETSSGQDEGTDSPCLIMLLVFMAIVALALGMLCVAYCCLRCVIQRSKSGREQAKQGATSNGTLIIVQAAREKEDNMSEIASVSTDDAITARLCEPSLSGDSSSKEDEPVYAVV